MPETSIIPKIAEFGIGIFAIGSVSYILFTFIKSHKDELTNSRLEREKNQTWFMTYVNENNHQKADLIREHVETSVQIKNAIEIHNKALERLIDKIN